MASVTKTITETIEEVQQTTSLYFASFEDFMEYERVVNGVAATGDVNLSVTTTTTKAPLTKLEVGKQYRITRNLHGHGFDIGTVVVVVSADVQEGEYKAELLDGSDYWYIQPEEVEEI